SHSSVRAIKDIPRNLTDEEICAIADKSGLIQVATGRWCLSDLPREQVNISVFCDHVDHVRNLVGADHVGIGTDFDGGGGMVGFEDVSKMKYVTVELLRRGWPEKDIRKFWGENFLRVLREVEKISRQINH
nr:membrane dipeptidase [Bacteroidales bacterium]